MISGPTHGAQAKNKKKAQALPAAPNKKCPYSAPAPWERVNIKIPLLLPSFLFLNRQRRFSYFLKLEGKKSQM